MKPPRNIRLFGFPLSWVLASCALSPAADQTEQFSPVYGAGRIPFALNIEQVQPGIPELPTLHSYVAAHDGAAWLFLGGRTNGLHGMTGMGAFPTASASADLWVVDLPAGRSWRLKSPRPVVSPRRVRADRL